MINTSWTIPLLLMMMDRRRGAGRGNTKDIPGIS